MNDKTIKLKGLPSTITNAEIRDAFENFQLKRIHISGDEAFLLLGHSEDLESLEFVYDGLIVPALASATIDSVSQDFDWAQLSDGQDQITSIKSNSEEEPAGEYPVLEPQLGKIVIVRGCDPIIVGELSEGELLEKVFSNFQVEKLRKVPRNHSQTVLVVEVKSQDEMEKIDLVFPGLKVPALGKHATVDTLSDEVNIEEMEQQWLLQYDLEQKTAEKEVPLEIPPFAEEPLSQPPGRNLLQYFFLGVVIMLLLYMMWV